MKKIILIYLFVVSNLLLGHSGRTDSNGGHRDNRNKSGLGYYHYHHGYGPHLHEDGVCPYEIEEEVEVKKTETKKIVSITKKKLEKKKEKLYYSIDDVYTYLTWKGYRGENSLENFKSDNGMPFDNIIDEKVLKLLGMEIKYK